MDDFVDLRYNKSFENLNYGVIEIKGTFLKYGCFVDLK